MTREESDEERLILEKRKILEQIDFDKQKLFFIKLKLVFMDCVDTVFNITEVLFAER